MPRKSDKSMFGPGGIENNPYVKLNRVIIQFNKNVKNKTIETVEDANAYIACINILVNGISKLKKV